MAHYVVILAGGKGERLWPLSRKNKPKQLLPFAHSLSLLEQTVQRLLPFVSDKKYLWVITTQEQKPLIEELVKDTIGYCMTEPSSRNTGPAIALTCLTIAKQDPQAHITFVPADHYIPHQEQFSSYFNKAMQSSCDAIILLGLKPQWAATGYGYIEYDSSGKEPYRITRFHEKPTLEQAERYLKQKNMLWNIGIFSAPVQTFIKELQLHAPSLFNGVQDYFHNVGNYNTLENISIDYALIEKTNNCRVIPAQFEWSDVGNLDTFLSLQQQAYLTPESKIVTLEAHNNLVAVPKKLVALINVHNMCIVETDDVLLIAERSQVEKVKSILKQLSQQTSHTAL